MGSSPERDWGRQSWPDNSGGRGRSYRSSGGEKGCRKTAVIVALVLLAVPALLVAYGVHVIV